MKPFTIADLKDRFSNSHLTFVGSFLWNSGTIFTMAYDWTVTAGDPLLNKTVDINFVGLQNNFGRLCGIH